MADYRLVGCWVGTLAATPFVYDEFASAQGGGLAVAYGRKLVAHVVAGGGPPVVVRFTGTSACWTEQAGAYYFEVDLETGRVQSGPYIQRTCAPPRWPPYFVLGLTGQRYPFGIELRRSGHTATPPARDPHTTPDLAPDTAGVSGLRRSPRLGAVELERETTISSSVATTG